FSVCASSLLARDRHQLDVELQGRIRRNGTASGGAVSQGWRDGQTTLPADTHSWDSLIPAGDHLARPEPEGERLVPVVRAVELGAVEQGADVVDGQGVAGHRGGAGADHQVLDHQCGGTGWVVVPTAAAQEGDQRDPDKE